MLASTSGAIIVGFNVRPDANAKELCRPHTMWICACYRVIYDAINEIETAMKGMLAPKFEEVVIWATPRSARDLQGHRRRHGGRLLCVKDGKMQRETPRSVCCGTISSSTRARWAPSSGSRTAVKEVAAGYECGMSIVKFNDIREGDVFECFVMQEIKR